MVVNHEAVLSTDIRYAQDKKLHFTNNTVFLVGNPIVFCNFWNHISMKVNTGNAGDGTGPC